MKIQFNLLTQLTCILALLVVAGCTYDKAQDATPVVPFVSYKDEVKPIIAANCYQCHASTSTDPERPGYAFLDSFSELQRYALKTSTANSAYTTLQARLRHIENPGMPFKKAQLPEIQIVLIENWIKAGAPNN